MPEDKVIPVRVAVRCRPLVTKEICEGCKQCVTFVPNEPQIILGKDKNFTYDYVFKPETSQNDIYESAVTSLVDGIFKGYNATVLAYGQTGSGKTFTMGGGYGVCLDTDHNITGVIPRVIRQLFEGVRDRSNEYKFSIKVSYLEIYKEDLLDLLCAPAKRDKDGVAVREDVNGGIRLQGLTEVAVEDVEGTMHCLERGSNGRTTGSTAMNASSSRSHAIFTIHIDKVSRDDSNDLCTMKFHLVDLAGSERAKKTNAEGERFKEGVNINKGLLALGNVISALGDDTQKRSHIPYRDSKLTRLLQDSLGGNSLTLMIACVSPADSNMEETISTLRYADRARKIKNKPVVNRDPQTAEILRLKQMVQDMQIQMMQGGKGVSTLTSQSVVNKDNPAHINKIKELEDENKKLSKNLQNALQQNASIMERLMHAETSRDNLKEALEELREKSKVLLNKTYDTKDIKGNESVEEMDSLVRSLQDTINTIGAEHLTTIQEASNENGSSVNNSLTEDDEANRDHVMKLQNYQDQLAELDDIIQSKQDLATKMASGEGNWTEMKNKYEKEIDDMESEIAKMMKEKEEMQKALQNVKSTSATSKLSEQRRKKLQELEAQINQLRKKVVDQSKLLKLKEQTEKQLQKCNQDIMTMKQQRVKLMKQMKEDSEKFRHFKQAKDKELTQLKAKERKREAEVVKMNRDFQRQQNVLKRKADEAFAVNKRLQDALAKQKQASEDRMKKQEKSDQGGIGARVRKWLSQEFDVLVGVQELRLHLGGLINDRKDLSAELESLKDQLKEGPPTKRRSLNDKSWRDSDEGKEQIREKIKTLEQEIEFRSTQINEIQERLMDTDQDEKNKTRWNSMHTMIEARCGLKWLMSTAVSAKVQCAKLRGESTDLQGQLEDAVQNAKAGAEELHKLQRGHDKQIHKVTKDHEEKVIYLLNQLKNSSSQFLDSECDEKLKQRLKFQGAEIEKLSRQREEMNKKGRECEKLRKELTKANYLSSVTHNQSLMPDLEGGDTPMSTAKPGKGASNYFSEIFSPSITPAIKKKRTKRKKALEDVKEFSSSEESDEEEVDDEDESDEAVEDPDWEQGYTPGISRRSMIAKNRRRTGNVGCGIDEEEEKAESSPDARATCKCRGTCSTRLCKCKKTNNKCDENECGCTSSKCLNREPQLPESTTDDSGELLGKSSESTSTLNTTFNVAYVESTDGDSQTSAEVSRTSAEVSRTSAEVSSSNKTVLKDTSNNIPKGKRAKSSDDTVKSYHNLFGKNLREEDNPSDDSLKDFDTEGIGLGGMQKKKKRTLLKSGATKTIFNQNL